VKTTKLAAATLALSLFASLAASAEDSMVKGEVKKIDQAAGKITLKHGPAKSLGMDEPMTMVYRAKDPEMLKQVKVGDQVRFEAENADAGYTVTKLQKTK
jgi:Cu/Ag efflux protein CusF